MAEGRVERRLTAILAADVAGYSRLMGSDEEGTVAALKACRRDLIDPKIAEHRGRIVKTTGDGALVEFASVVDAMRCAVDIQRSMAARNAGIANDKRVEFRMGVNVGDIIIDGGDIFGDGVNVAARLEGLAEPGGICVSARVQEDVRGKLDIAFADEGEQQLKNIAWPVRVYRVQLGGAASSARTALPLPEKPSIAVLPFDSLSAGPDQVMRCGDVARFLDEFYERANPLRLIPPAEWTRQVHRRYVQNAHQWKCFATIKHYLPFLNMDVAYDNSRLREELGSQAAAIPPITDYLAGLLSLLTPRLQLAGAISQ